MKQNKTINMFKSLFGKDASWQKKYASIQGKKLYIYKDNNYSKPQYVIDLSEDIKVEEVRKSDVKGKQLVIALTSGKDKHLIAIATKTMFEKWYKAFKSVK